MKLSALSRLLLALLFAALFLPGTAAAQTTHIVTVGDNFFSPSNLTIQVGDTVEWRNAAGGNSHNVTASNGSFSSGTSSSFTFSRTFNSAGTVNYECTLHGNMNGTITVQAADGSADLAVQSVNATNGTYAPGDGIAVALGIQNMGTAASSAFTVRIYASTNSTINGSDTEIGSSARAALAAGQTSNFDVNGTFPGNIADGNYFIGTIIEINDSNNANNTGHDQTAITVMDSGFAMNAGLNGNWSGAGRSGEGFNLEISSQTNNDVLVAQFYTYDTSGNQVWLLAVGPVNGDSAEVTVYIYSNAKWGDDFVPADVLEEEWGSGLFVANSCDSISMSLTPNSTALSNGFTGLEYDLVRVTTPLVDCPSPP